MSIGPGPIREVGAGLKQAWTDAKTSFAPVVKEMKGLPKKALEASKKVLAEAAENAIKTSIAFQEADKTYKHGGVTPALLWGGTLVSSLVALPMAAFSPGASDLLISGVGIATGLMGSAAVHETSQFMERIQVIKKSLK